MSKRYQTRQLFEPTEFEDTGRFVIQYVNGLSPNILRYINLTYKDGIQSMSSVTRFLGRATICANLYELRTKLIRSLKMGILYYSNIFQGLSVLNLDNNVSKVIEHYFNTDKLLKESGIL